MRGYKKWERDIMGIDNHKEKVEIKKYKKIIMWIIKYLFFNKKELARELKNKSSLAGHAKYFRFFNNDNIVVEIKIYE